MGKAIEVKATDQGWEMTFDWGRAFLSREGECTVDGPGASEWFDADAVVRTATLFASYCETPMAIAQAINLQFAEWKGMKTLPGRG